MNNRRNKKITKNLKDYIVPIIWVLIVLIIIINFIFSSWDDTKNSNIVNNVPLSVTFSDTETEWYISYSSWDKKKIEQNSPIYKWEKLEVWTKWEVNISLPEDSWNMSLNKLWELMYNEDGSYSLLSSDLWINSKKSLNVEMRFMKVSSSNEASFNLTQNEVASSIYVVFWNVEVKNSAWSKTSLQQWQKLTIMRNEATDANVDLALKKENIDDYIKNEDWFVKNNWASLLSKVSSTTSNTWTTTSSWSVMNNNITNWAWFNYITFNVADESDVTSSTIDINWSILDSIVAKIEINNQTADINSTDKTFSVKWVKLNSKVNDIVYRVYDDWNKLIDKWIITLYYAWWTVATNNSGEKASWLAGVENYSLTTSPTYQIISPKQNPYTTTENLVMIEWTVPARTVKKIIVNWFQLQAFPANWTYWKYFANSEYWNLKEWLNMYKIEYYWADDKVIFENMFAIIKEKTTNNTENNPAINTTSTWETN